MDQELKHEFEKINQRIDTLPTKTDLDNTVEQLVSVINKTIAEPMEKHFAEHKRDLDVSKDVEILKLDMQKIKDALAINDGQPVKIS